MLTNWKKKIYNVTVSMETQLIKILAGAEKHYWSPVLK